MNLEFKLPILELLEELPSHYYPNQTMLGELITRLHCEVGMSQREIAMILCVSETTVQSRIPRDMKKVKRRDEEARKIEQLYKQGKIPKEIAYTLQIPIKRVYSTLKEIKK